MKDRPFLILVALTGLLVATVAVTIPRKPSRGQRLPPRRSVQGGWSGLWRGPRRVILFSSDLKAIHSYVGWKNYRDSRFPGFKQLPPPGLGSWRAGPGKNERHQTFDTFRRLWTPLPVYKKTLVLRRVSLPTSQPLARKELAALEPVMSEFLALYYGLETRWEKPLTEWIQKRKRRSFSGAWTQLLTQSVARQLAKSLPWDARLVMGVTHHDLYPHPSWNFVFGEVFPTRRVGVMSTARLGEDFPPPDCGQKGKDKNEGKGQGKDKGQEATSRGIKKKNLLRTLKILAHEVGHILGLPHCIAYSCLMNGCNNLQESDRVPIHLCPLCLAKMSWSLGLDPQKRYERLGKFFQKHGLKNQAQWYEEQANRVKTARAPLP